MTNNLKQKLAEISERAKAATPGPWITTRKHAMGETWFNVAPPGIDRDVLCMKGDLNNEMQSDPDATFVANARTDIPALLAVIDLLLHQRDSNLKGDWDERNQWKAEPLIEELNAELLEILERGK